MKANGSLHWRFVARLAIVATLLLLTGCGNYGKVSGKLTYKGQAVPKATITFLSTDGIKVVVAKSDDQGNYTAKLPIGKFKISLQTEAKPEMMAQMMAQAGQSRGAKDSKGDVSKGIEQFQKNVPGAGGGEAVGVPPQYADPEKSGLTVEVKGGSQSYDITLSD